MLGPDVLGLQASTLHEALQAFVQSEVARLDPNQFRHRLAPVSDHDLGPLTDPCQEFTQSGLYLTNTITQATLAFCSPCSHRFNVVSMVSDVKAVVFLVNSLDTAFFFL